MFDARTEAVNLSTPIESTIRWLRERSSALPLRHRLSWWWVPARCACCGQRGDLGAIDLCAACLAEFPFRPPPEAPADPALPLVAFAYEDPVGSGLRALKYRGDLRPARLLGTLLAAHAAQSRAALPQLLVPVPLHPSRLGERGFNQSEQLARHAAAWLALPVASHLLRRCRATVPQAGLEAAARVRNVAGAFAPAPGAATWLAARRIRRVALLDDVLTTGATVRAAAAALQGCGLEDCRIWAVAQVRGPVGEAPPLEMSE
jgi:ComF family protein